MILFAFILFAALIAGWLMAPNGTEKAPAKVEAVAARLKVGEAAA
jgi:hypothetical protein